MSPKITSVVLAISETHLDASVMDSEREIPGYSIFISDRDHRGGGVVFYILSHICVKTRDDLIFKSVESIWLQVHLPNVKPLLFGCCYRPPSSNVQYVDNICDMLQRAVDENKETYFFGDFNIDWQSKTCTLKNRLLVMANVCNLTQIVNLSTRVSCNITGTGSSTCIDHILYIPMPVNSAPRPILTQ